MVSPFLPFVTEAASLPRTTHSSMAASMPPPLFSRSYPPLQSAAAAAAAAASTGLAALASSTLDGYKATIGQRFKFADHHGSMASDRSAISQGTVNYQLGHLENLTISGSDLWDSEMGDTPHLKPASIISEDSIVKSRGGENFQEMNPAIVSKGNLNANVLTSVSMNAVSNSTTSDEDQQQHQQPKDVDDRKQKRMLSNRESARRSRLRKQQHLDDLRAQVAHLRAENSLMMNRYNLASQQYTQLTDENRVLRSHAVDLSCQLDRLRQAAHQQAARQPFGINPSLLDPFPLTSSYLTSYSQQQRL